MAARGMTLSKFGTPAAYSGSAKTALNKLVNTFPAVMPPSSAGRQSAAATPAAAPAWAQFYAAFFPHSPTRGSA